MWRRNYVTHSHIMSYNVSLLQNMSSNLEIEKRCVYCGNKFIAKTLKTKYCSHKCNSRHYKQRKRQEKINSHLEEQISPPSTQNIKVDLKEKEFLNVAQTALLIGVSRRTIYRMLKSEELRYHKLGNRTIIKRADINKLFE